MDSLLLLDAGSVIRECIADDHINPLFPSHLSAFPAEAEMAARGCGNHDICTVVAFDEPQCDAITFSPKIRRTDLAEGYHHAGYDMSDPTMRIPVQAWKQRMCNDRKVLSYPGAEARDLIASLIGMLGKFGSDAPDVIIWSDDAILLQCVDDGRRVRMMGGFAGGDDPYPSDEHAVTGYMGVPPAKMRMLMTVIGDRMDGYGGLGLGRSQSRDIVSHANGMKDIADEYHEKVHLLARNWKLAGTGDGYLDGNALSRVADIMAWIMGPDF